MKHGISISLRLTLWFSSIFLCGFTVFGVVMWFDLANSLEQGRDRTLNNRARRLLEKLTEQDDEGVPPRRIRYQAFAEATPEGHQVHVFDASGKRLFPQESNAENNFPWPRIPISNSDFRDNLQIRDRYFRILVKNATLDGQPVRIFVAGQLEDNRQQVKHFTEGLLRSLPVLVICAGLAGYFVSRRALDPVARLIETGRSITIGNLSRRLPVSGSGDELARLAETWNDMLERLEAAVNRITRFTADASHELRSPLSYIRIASESMLRQEPLDPEVEETFREIVAEAEKASQLLDEMLLLARSDAGHVSATFSEVPIAEIVREVTNKLNVMAEAKNQQLEERQSYENLLVISDAALLRRLTWILLDNAIKNTPCGGHIAISVAREGTHVSLEVADNGCGIPPDALPHIFDRFYRVDPARSEQDGTGLGLAIAKWIVDTHRGEIRVTSQPQVGSTFQVKLPIAGTS